LNKLFKYSSSKNVIKDFNLKSNNIVNSLTHLDDNLINGLVESRNRWKKLFRFKTRVTNLFKSNSMRSEQHSIMHNFLEDRYNIIKSRKTSSKLLIPQYFFTSRFNEKIMPSQLRHWRSSRYNFLKKEKSGNTFLEIYVSNLIQLFFRVKSIFEKDIYHKNVSNIVHLEFKNSFIYSINKIIKYTTNRLVNNSKLHHLPSYLLKTKFIGQQITHYSFIINKLKDMKNVKSGFFSKRSFKIWRHVILSIPLFKYTSYNIIIDLFVYNNKFSTHNKFYNLLLRRGLYKYMYSLYYNNIEKIKVTINRPRFFYINLIEPKVYSFYNHIVKIYQRILINNNRTFLIYITQLFFNFNNYIFTNKKKSSILFDRKKQTILPDIVLVESKKKQRRKISDEKSRSLKIKKYMKETHKNKKINTKNFEKKDPKKTKKFEIIKPQNYYILNKVSYKKKEILIQELKKKRWESHMSIIYNGKINFRKSLSLMKLDHYKDNIYVKNKDSYVMKVKKKIEQARLIQLFLVQKPKVTQIVSKANIRKSSIFYKISKLFRIKKRKLNKSFFMRYIQLSKNFFNTNKFWFRIYYLGFLNREFNYVYKDIVKNKMLDIIPYSHDYFVNTSLIDINDKLIIEYPFKKNVSLKIHIYNNYDGNKRREDNQFLFYDKYFKPYYRYILKYYILEYYKIFIRLMKFSHIPFINNIKSISDYNSKLYYFVIVKTVFGLIQYNYRSLIRLKPKYYYLNKLRYYETKFNRLNMNTWLTSIKYIRMLRKTPKNFWKRYHKLASFYFERIIQNGELSTKRNIFIPFVLYLEDLLYNIFGKWVIIRLWPLRKQVLSIYMLVRIIAKVTYSRKSIRVHHLNQYRRVIIHLMNIFKLSTLNSTYSNYLNKGVRWPTPLVNIMGSNTYNNLEVLVKKKDKNDILTSYFLEGENISTFLPKFSNNYYHSYNISKNKTKNRWKLFKRENKKLGVYLRFSDITRLEYVNTWVGSFKNYIRGIKRYIDIIGMRAVFSGRPPIRRGRGIHRNMVYGRLTLPRYWNAKTRKYLTLSKPRLKGYIQSNIVQEQIDTVNIRGAVTFKLWLNSSLSSDWEGLILYFIRIKSLYNQLLNRHFSTNRIIALIKYRRGIGHIYEKILKDNNKYRNNNKIDLR
jgi:hypothetical protein